MFKLLRKLCRKLFTPKEHVHIISRLPIGLELSDGDRAALYGWPDFTVHGISCIHHSACSRVRLAGSDTCSVCSAHRTSYPSNGEIKAKINSFKQAYRRVFGLDS